jgi:hypothetical protein
VPAEDLTEQTTTSDRLTKISAQQFLVPPMKKNKSSKFWRRSRRSGIAGESVQDSRLHQCRPFHRNLGRELLYGGRKRLEEIPGVGKAIAGNFRLS